MKRFLIFFSLVLLVLGACRDRNSQVPLVGVNIVININEPQYFDISVPSGYVYIIGGSQGIIVYRAGQDEFVAIERHSPYNVEDNCRVEVTEDGIILEDPCSGSQWLIQDGSIVRGPTNFALTLYNTEFQNPYLTITN